MNEIDDEKLLYPEFLMLQHQVILSYCYFIKFIIILCLPAIRAKNVPINPAPYEVV